MRSLCLVLLASLALAVRATLVIESADRLIDGQSQTISVRETLKIRNDGTDAAKGVILCDSKHLFDNSAIYEVVVGNSRLPAEVADPPGKPEDVECRRYTLPSELARGKTVEVRVAAVYPHVLTPKPAAVAPSEPQRVLFEGKLFVQSPYLVASQTTKFEAASPNMDEYTQADPFKTKGKLLTYGPFTDVKPFSGLPLRVHYENNSPFAEALSVEREIEISHWGNVYFEERYKLRHGGARVKGEWSRLEYMTRQTYGRNAIRELVAVMDGSARSLYYRDEIGNISSSATRHMNERVVVNLATRYPLFGGWTSTFIFGYSLPLQRAVTKVAGGKVALTTAIGPALQNLVVDELTLKVVLPEGATDAEVTPPVEMEQWFDKKYTYLDVLGRTVVTLRRRNVVPQMAELPFQVSYRYSALGLLQKPLVLVTAFASVFLLLLLVNRGSSKQHDC